ncbi:hypothetical protein BGX31_005097, partial [Mortierella sp. GBA43]
ISGGDFDSCDLEIIAESVLPRVNRLSLVKLDSWEIKYILDRCHKSKWYLDVSIIDNPDEIPYNDNDSDTDEDQDDNDDWQSEGEQITKDHERKLWGLGLQSCNRRSEKFWSWFWKQFGSSRYMIVGMLHKAVIRSLVRNISTDMPMIDTIFLGGRRLKLGLDMTDSDVAMLLSSPGREWSNVTIGKSAQFGDKAMNALTEHFLTLRMVEITTQTHSPGDYLIQILSSCPNLVTFTVYDNDDSKYSQDTHIGAEMFIDRDPHTGSLKTWACEDTLIVLGIFIPGFLRDHEEAYDGHGREIQSLVYERLSRMVNLMSLRVGPCYGYESRAGCIDMSLESGLRKLEGLKLGSLDVRYLRTGIGLEEVQWMFEHWPTLLIYGLDTNANYENDNNREALEWLKVHHPGSI